MPIPERDPTFTPTEHKRAPERRQRQQGLLGEQAALSFTLLPEIDTANDEIRDYLQSRVIGQDAAVAAIIDALDRSEARSYNDRRPKATFAFLGPTGLGKTETAKALSEILAPGVPNLITISCAMYSHGHEVASLTGSPPGYVGREQRPVLDAELVEQEGTVILFDEIEKGARELHNLLLHITDQGELMLNNGTIVSFRDAIIVMTSNLGAREMAREMGGGRAGFGTEDTSLLSQHAIDAAALKGFSDFFSPEFVGRVRPIVFHPLNEASLHKVLDVKMGDLNKAYADDFGAIVDLSPMARQYLVGQALVRKASGVRPLVDALDSDIAATFGRYVAYNHIQEGTEVYVYHRDEFEDALPSTYSSELVFATRRNPGIKKRLAVPVPSTVFGPSVNLEEAVDLHDSPDEEPDEE